MKKTGLNKYSAVIIKKKNTKGLKLIILSNRVEKSLFKVDIYIISVYCIMTLELYLKSTPSKNLLTTLHRNCMTEKCL